MSNPERHKIAMTAPSGKDGFADVMTKPSPKPEPKQTFEIVAYDVETREVSHVRPNEGNIGTTLNEVLKEFSGVSAGRDRVCRDLIHIDHKHRDDSPQRDFGKPSKDLLSDIMMPS